MDNVTELQPRQRPALAMVDNDPAAREAAREHLTADEAEALALYRRLGLAPDQRASWMRVGAELARGLPEVKGSRPLDLRTILWQIQQLTNQAQRLMGAPGPRE